MPGPRPPPARPPPPPPPPRPPTPPPPLPPPQLDTFLTTVVVISGVGVGVLAAKDGIAAAVVPASASPTSAASSRRPGRINGSARARDGPGALSGSGRRPRSGRRRASASRVQCGTPGWGDRQRGCREARAQTRSFALCRDRRTVFRLGEQQLDVRDPAPAEATLA